MDKVIVVFVTALVALTGCSKKSALTAEEKLHLHDVLKKTNDSFTKEQADYKASIDRMKALPGFKLEEEFENQEATKKERNIQSDIQQKVAAPNALVVSEFTKAKQAHGLAPECTWDDNALDFTCPKPGKK